MNDFEIREIPSGKKKGRWTLIADAIKANRGKAVFIAANGSKPINVRSGGIAAFARLGVKHVRSSTTRDGVYFWLDENGA